ncbi:MAG TPA: DUF4199 domain-containing protein [Candidatus Didemnitutus sp.]|nr:DUF4199 domain-containing protein [Candidatus Didemnitutus sp.]
MTPEFRYGLIAGAGLCLWTLLEFVLGLHTVHFNAGEISGYLAGIVPFVCLWLLLRRRQRELGPLFSIWVGLFSGVICSIVAAVVVYAFMVAYDLYLNPGWLDIALKNRVDAWRAAHIDEVEIRRMITAIRNTQSPIGLLVTYLGGVTLLGTLMTLVITSFMLWERKKLLSARSPR